MKLTSFLNRLLKRKLVTAVLISVSLAAFATLGDGGGSKKNVRNFNSKNFSLKSTYNYRGSNIFSNPCTNTNNCATKFITLNTVVTYQKGNSTYILPMKRKILLEKVKFNPAPTRF